jgi:hypothetical protein
MALAVGMADGAAAGDGRVEIHQARVLAAGGFPFVIASPGSYVLTSDLVVSATNVPAVRIDADEVTLDLNGFRVAGPGSGTGDGVQSNGRQVTVANGTVRSFGGAGVRLGLRSRAHDLRVFDNGDSGIVTGDESLVLRCQSFGNGGVGLALGGETAFHDNVVAGNALGSVTGGSATGGNVCDDRACLREGRRYYLTPTSVPGDQALTHCAAGFHMASLYELWGFDGLRYAAALGQIFPNMDVGSGPPANIDGYVRSGSGATSSGGSAGPNCDAWTTSSGTGLVAHLRAPFFIESSGPNAWEVAPLACSPGSRVWCIED